MKKLKLELDELKIQSFGTTPDEDMQRGTVQGASGCCYTGSECTKFWSTCEVGDETKYYCPVTGMDSCGDSCGCTGALETCQYPCAFSEMTDCHRC